MQYLNLFILYFVILFLTKYISSKTDLYDRPNKRKIHSTKTFNTGGLIIYAFYLIIINSFEFNYNIELIISIGFFVCLIGFIDDRINLSPYIKIIFIIIPTLYLIFSGIKIENIGIYEFIGVLNLGKFQIPFLILSTTLLINAINYIDGIDGLILVFFISCLTYYIFLIDDADTINLLKLLLFPLIINLILNMLPSKSNFKFFSGNIGSLFIGFFISFLTINLYSEFNIHPVYLIWPLWYPVSDFLFVSFNRIINKKSVFKADNSHLHHIIFNKLKKNHFKTVILFFGSNVSIISAGYMLSNYSKLLSLIIFILGSVFYFILRFKFEK